MKITLLENGKKTAFEGQCRKLFPGGMQVRLKGLMPALLIPMHARMKGANGELEFSCEVVRHVSAADAAAWGMDEGCVLQFLNPAPNLMESIARLMNGGAAPAPLVDLDPELKHLLRSHWSADDEDHYLLLGVTDDVELSAARRRGRECRAKLEQARNLSLDSRDRALVQPAIERVNQAMLVLGDPVQRAEYDASRGNFHGVARCIQAGITVTDLELCRRRHLARTPHAARTANSYASAARELEHQGQRDEALTNYERALALDPLDLKLHLSYARARRGSPLPGRSPTA